MPDPIAPPRLTCTTDPVDLDVVRSVVAEIRAAPAPAAGAPRLLALVAPHLELAVARRVYRHAYAALRGLAPGGRSPAPARIVILGTGHALAARPLAVTMADFETPFGCWPTDREAVRRLRLAGDEAVADDDQAQRGEHSIAHQLLFLHHLIGDQAQIPIVPVLFGPLAHTLEVVDRPAELPELEPFLAALASLIDERTLVVASVDLAHVGPRYGDPLPAVDYEAACSAHDRALLAALCRGAVGELWREARRVGDRFRVCGLPVLACLLEVLPKARGRVLDYAVCPDAASASAVSCAAVAISAG